MADWKIEDGIPIPRADVGKGGRRTYESSHYPQAKLIIEKYFTEWFQSGAFKSTTLRSFAENLQKEHDCHLSIEVIERYMRRIKKTLEREREKGS